MERCCLKCLLSGLNYLSPSTIDFWVICCRHHLFGTPLTLVHLTDNKLEEWKKKKSLVNVINICLLTKLFMGELTQVQLMAGIIFAREKTLPNWWGADTLTCLQGSLAAWSFGARCSADASRLQPRAALHQLRACPVNSRSDLHLQDRSIDSVAWCSEVELPFQC